MAFRIHDSVVRGEIDNRVKSVVRGKVWLENRAEPLTLIGLVDGHVGRQGRLAIGQLL